MPIKSNTVSPSMQTPGRPPQEAERLAALTCLGILDTPPSEAFDRITHLAAQFLDVPIALVSLVDEKRQWFKSRHGLEVSQTSRELSFCAHAVCEREVLNVPDATQDARFAGNPLVTGAPDIRAYLGVPLLTRAGHAIGALCVIDTRPRLFDEASVGALENLAKVLQDQIQAQEFAAEAEHVLQHATAQEKLFRDTFEQAAVGIVHTDLAGQLQRVNGRACWMLGYTHAELSAMSFVDITHPDDLAGNVALFNQMVSGELDSYPLEKRFVCKDGKSLWVHLSVALKRSASGAPDYIITVIEDIAARKQAEAELIEARDSLRVEVARQTAALQTKNRELQTHIIKALTSEKTVRTMEHRLRSITDHVPANIGYWNRNLTCEFANESYRASFGLSPEEMLGKWMPEVLGEMLFETVEPHIRQTLAGYPQRFERTIAKPDGTEAIFELRYIPDFDGTAQVRGFFVLGSDVAESRRERLALEVANSRLTKETMTDFLTGISNRRVFSERSEEASRRFKGAGETYGLILLDLDNFKQINDVHGHDVGDDALRIVGRLLKSELRSHRDIAARLGGEEFAILCFGELDAELLHLIAERVRQKMSRESIQTVNGKLTFTASFGLALSHSSDTGWKDIYARADTAMYEAKAAGKNQVKFSAAYVPGGIGQSNTLRIVSKH